MVDGWSVGKMTDCRVAGWLVGWLNEWLVGWLVGCLAGCLAGWLVGWPPGFGGCGAAFHVPLLAVGFLSWAWGTGSNRAQNTASILGDFLDCLGCLMYC